MLFRLSIGLLGLLVTMAGRAQAQWYVSGSLGANKIVSQSANVLVPSSPSGGDIDNSGVVGVGIQSNAVPTFDPASAGGLSGVISTADLAPPAFVNVPVKVDFGVGISGNAALGYRLPWNFRIEVEGGYIHSNISKLTVAGTSVPGTSGDVGIWTGTVNAFYDIRTGTKFVPYLGGGVGIANERVSNINIAGISFGSSGSSTHLLWQVEAGVGYEIAPHFTIRPAYRFQQIDDGNPSTQIHVFKVGLQYDFN